MLLKEWSVLKNGSDIRGVASEGIEGAHINLTDEVCEKIASAFVLFVANKTGKKSSDIKIAIGHDSRNSAERLKLACIRAITGCGAKAVDCSLATTPAMFMITVDKEFSVDASIMLTASHLPFNRNGLKFFTPDGGLEGSDITEILTYAQDNKRSDGDGGKVEKCNYIEKYAQDIRNKIIKGTGLSLPFENMKIAVDAGNGAGGFYAQKVLLPLGADVSGSQFLDPDGNFPNHIPNPEDKDAMKAISSAVKASSSDLGIIFDTDVDRAAIVSDDGREINKNSLIALISAVLAEEKRGTIVTDSVTSTGLKDFIENDLKCKHLRFKRGYKNVINEAKRLNKEGEYSPLAIETSGHAALYENYFLDDGAYLVTKLLIKAVLLRKEGKKLTDLIKTLKEPAISRGHRLNLLCEDFKGYGENILSALKEEVEKQSNMSLELPNFEGVRVNVDEGWFLLRLSLHDPLMPLDIQCDSEETLEKIYGFLRNFLKGFESIDISALG